MDLRTTATVASLPVSRRDDVDTASQARRNAAAAEAAAPVAVAPVSQKAPVSPAAKSSSAQRAPGTTTAFTAGQAQFNADVTAAQRALSFVDAASGQLRGLKGALSAMLTGADRGGEVAARIAKFDALWSERATMAGGMIDAQLTVRPTGDATRTFRVRALDVEQWRSSGAETLTFHPTGVGKQSVAVSFEAAPIDAATFAKRLDRALAATGVRASLAADGQVDFTVAESRWPAVRDQLLVQGGGKRFPGGRPIRAQADAAPEALEPARWQVSDRTGQRAALRDVVRGLDKLMQADRTLRTQLDTAGQRLRNSAGEAAKQAATASESVSGTLAASSEFNVLSAVTTTLSGLSRARVETLLKL